MRSKLNIEMKDTAATDKMQHKMDRVTGDLAESHFLIPLLNSTPGLFSVSILSAFQTECRARQLKERTTLQQSELSREDS